jgi:CBS-domain-containing membrane protein
MLVKDAMTRHAESVEPDVSLTYVARQLKEQDIACLPVYENGKLIGMITDRDIVCRGVAVTDNLMDMKARDVMTVGTCFVTEDQDLEDAVRLMGDKEIYHLPVLDRQNRLTGMLALADLALKGSQEFLGIMNALVARDATRHRELEAAASTL